MAPGQPRVRHNGHVTKRVMLVLLNVVHKTGWWIGAAQHGGIAENRMSFQVKHTQRMSYLISLTWVFSFIKQS